MIILSIVDFAKKFDGEIFGGVLNHVNWQRPTPKAAMNDKPKNDSMHEMEFRKANPFSDQSAAPGTKGKMVAFNSLSISFSGNDSTLGYLFLISVIAIGIDRVNMERRQQRSQFVQVFVFMCTKAMVLPQLTVNWIEEESRIW